jgi:hypothetical protein
MKVLTWYGTGVIVVHKKLDAGMFALPRAMRAGDQHVVDSHFSAGGRFGAGGMSRNQRACA